MHGYVALNESINIIGNYIYTVFEKIPTAHELTFVFIDKEWRGKGIGTMLMTQLMSQIMNKPAIVIVKITGHKNDEFYRNNGYFSCTKNVIPIKRHDFIYMYFTTSKYIQICNLMSMFMKS